MIVRYDALDRLEKPVMTLCKPGATYVNGVVSKTVGTLFGTEAEELVLNFNSVSELNFRINRLSGNSADEDTRLKSIYLAVKNRMLIFIDHIGFFSITDTEEKLEDGVQYKDVKAESIDVELQQRMIPFIEDGTYQFFTQAGASKKGLLNMIVERLPLWTIDTDNVDATIAAKSRTFEDVETNTNCLSFMIDRMQEAYECIILFDTINRRIRVYDQNTYTARPDVQTGITLSRDDLINSVTISEGSEDIYTALRVVGGDNEDVYISSVNPTGENVIYDFSYYYDWMTPTLKEKLIAWSAAVTASESVYRQLNERLNNLNDVLAVYIMDKDVLKQYLSIANQVISNVTADASSATINAGVTVLNTIGEAHDIEDVDDSTKENLIASVNANIRKINQDIASIDSSMAAVMADIETVMGQVLDIQNNLRLGSSGADEAWRLTSEEYDELCSYIFEGDYTDEYALITDTMTEAEKFDQRSQMYYRAKSQLAKASSPSQKFDIDVESFIFSRDFSHYASQLQTGCLINVGLDGFEYDQSIFFLSTITVNYDDKEMSLTIGNRYNKFDPRTLFENVLGSVSRSANSISYIKDVIYPIKTGELENDAVQRAIQDMRNVTMQNAITATDQSVIIDSSGYTGKRDDGNGGFEPEQVKIVNNSIVFTDDNWETCKTAIGKLDLSPIGIEGYQYGVNAEVLIGNMILTQNLKVLNAENENNATVIMDKDGLFVDGKYYGYDVVKEYSTTEWSTSFPYAPSYLSTVTISVIFSPTGFNNWFTDSYTGIVNGDPSTSFTGYVVIDDVGYELSAITIDNVRWLYYNYDTSAEFGSTLVDSNKPAFAIRECYGNVLQGFKTQIWATFEPPKTYDLAYGRDMGSETSVSNGGVTITEIGSTGLRYIGSNPIELISYLNLRSRTLYKRKGTLKVCSENNSVNSVVASDGLYCSDGSSDSFYGTGYMKTENIYADNIYIGPMDTNSKPIDYILAQGSSTSTVDNAPATFYYRKWNSGIMEIWGTVDYYSNNHPGFTGTAAVLNGVTVGYTTGSNGMSKILFPESFIEGPAISATANIGGSDINVTLAGVQADGFTPRLFSSTSSSIRALLRFNAIGRWRSA